MKLLTVREVSDILQVSYETALRLVKQEMPLPNISVPLNAEGTADNHFFSYPPLLQYNGGEAA